MLALASCAAGILDQPFGMWPLIDALCAALLLAGGVTMLRGQRGTVRHGPPFVAIVVLVLGGCSMLITLWTTVAALTYSGGCAPSVLSWPVAESEATSAAPGLGALVVLVTLVIAVGLGIATLRQAIIKRR